MKHGANTSDTLESFSPIGPARAELYRKLGIRRPLDILFFFPREYIEPATIHEYHQLESDTRATVVGTVDSIELRTFPDGRSMVGVLLKLDSSGFVRMVWFNQPFRAQSIQRGHRLQATGVTKATGVSYEMRHPEIQLLEEEDEADPGLPKPVYRLTDGLKQRHVADAVRAAIDAFASTIQESIPESLLEQLNLLPINVALEAIHRPKTMDEAQAARDRFILQELLVYQLALAVRRQKQSSHQAAPSIVASAAIHHRIVSRLGLTLTHDQQQAIDEICRDMQKTSPMNRLLQGDVGSGKTAVAVYAMLLAVANGYQATFMAPTEILARQHYERLKHNLQGATCEIGLLVGSLTASEKSDLQTQIAIGTVDIVIGTQALLSSKVEFNRLGLAVIDEQHKFGVAQRATLRGTEYQPHYLVLSATPIPRTLAMTAFGDLDISTIREKPAGRAVVQTYLANTSELPSWWSFIKKKVEEGRQAYIITPRVEGDESNDVIGAEDTFNHLSLHELKGLRLALLHGRIEPERKHETLLAFDRGEIDVLVATTVVEVGIDVPNATVMTILDADRLGLAQLHQLRGRVGRSHHPGYVCVLAKSNADADNVEKLKAFANTTDGFALADLDLQMRGPGNLLGTQQTGIPPFRIADIIRDQAALSKAREVAMQIVTNDPDLSNPKLSRLRSQVYARHGGMIEFGDVG